MTDDDEFDETLDKGDDALPKELHGRDEDSYDVPDEDDEPDPDVKHEGS